jgi:hypothetical protein
MTQQKGDNRAGSRLAHMTSRSYPLRGQRVSVPHIETGKHL